MKVGILSSGEITVGMKVTIHSWQPYELVVRGGFQETTTTITRTDKSWTVHLMEVVAVQPPFVVVKGKCFANGRYTLDLREVTFMELTAEMVKEMEAEEDGWINKTYRGLSHPLKHLNFQMGQK